MYSGVLQCRWPSQLFLPWWFSTRGQACVRALFVGGRSHPALAKRGATPAVSFPACDDSQVYQSVIFKERKGEYLGKTVQVVPHVTDEIQVREGHLLSGARNRLRILLLVWS